MSAYRGPDDPQRRLAWRRARRDVARAHHPDLGGDRARYVEQMRRVDQRFATAGLALPRDREPLRRRTSRIVAHARHRLRRRSRMARGWLPRGVPGARRYTYL